MVTTKQQKRATFALNMISNYNIDKDDANFIINMPTMLLSNGLGQTMAYLVSRKEKKDRLKTYKIIHDYLCERYSVFKDFKDDKDINSDAVTRKDLEFLKIFTSIKQNDYIKMQEDVLRMFEWLKRYARAFKIESKE